MKYLHGNENGKHDIEVEDIAEFDEIDDGEQIVLIWCRRHRKYESHVLPLALVNPRAINPNAAPLPRKKYFGNSQWIVTRFGVECLLHPVHFIERKELVDWRKEGILDWPLHYGGKIWVSLPLFAQAYRFALKKWHPEIAEAVIEASFEYARRVQANERD